MSEQSSNKLPKIRPVVGNSMYSAYVIAGIGIVLGCVGLIIGFQGFAAKHQIDDERAEQLPAYPTKTTTPSITMAISETPSVMISATPTITQKTVTMSVYLFSTTKFNQPGNSDYTQEVLRQTTRTDVATFGIEEIIKGPTTAEITQGLSPTFGTNNFVWFSETTSNCNGKDFTININTSKKATVKFCRNISIAGDMSRLVVEDQITKTLKQFPTIQKVIILNKDGNCFNDIKGSSISNDCE